MKQAFFNFSLLVSTLTLPLQASTNHQQEGLESSGKSQTVRIINGKDAKANAYPFMTALISAKNDNIAPFCGASFIGGRYVLTAAHCVEGESSASTHVWIGGHDISLPNSGKRVKVAQIYRHEQYNSETNDNDVAIVELVEDVTGVTPINIITPEIEASLADGFEFTVMGWGNVKTQGSPQYPEKLQEVNVPLYNRAQCNSDYRGISEQMMCAGFVEGGKDSCQGDSGGPLVFKQNGKWYQAGVVSFGNGCAQANAPGVYARLSKFNQWLEAKKAGVSYLQYTQQGYVEQSYNEQVSFIIKNVSDTPYSVTDASIANLVNLDTAQIANNQCLQQTLNFDQSCHISVNVNTNMLGGNGFTLNVSTDNVSNKQVKMFFNATSLEQDTLDFPALVGSNKEHISWWQGGNAKWQAVSNKTSQGDSAIASGNITDFESSVLLATISNDRIEAFNVEHLISSEQGYDILHILHNNQPVLKISGNDKTEFEPLTVKLGEGTDRIAFIYRKDSTDEGNVGDDKAYLDNVSTQFANKAPIINLTSSSITVQEGTSFNLDASKTTDPDGDTISYQWQVTSANKLTLPTPTKAQVTLTAPAFKDANKLTFTVTATDQYGASTQANVVVNITETPKSGGSLTWLLLPLSALLANRRRILATKPNN